MDFEITLSDQDAERIVEGLNKLRIDRLGRDQKLAAEKIRDLSLKIIDTYIESHKENP